MKSAFRCGIRKFLEKLVYWENALSNSSSLRLLTKRLLNLILKPRTGKLSAVSKELSGCEMWQKSSAECTEKHFSLWVASVCRVSP